MIDNPTLTNMQISKGCRDLKSIKKWFVQAPMFSQKSAVLKISNECMFNTDFIERVE